MRGLLVFIQSSFSISIRKHLIDPNTETGFIRKSGLEDPYCWLAENPHITDTQVKHSKQRLDDNHNREQHITRQ